MTLNCVDCGVPVGTTKDRSVPTRCQPCRLPDQGPTVGEALSDAQRFREEIEMDALLLAMRDQS